LKPHSKSRMRIAVPPRASLVFALLLLGGCGAPAVEPQDEANQSYRAGRDGLCLGQSRAGLITYGQGNVNCSVAGTATRNGNSVSLIPSGDRNCRIAVQIAGDTAVIGPRSPACAYYCGPGADFAGRSLTRSASAQAITDLAGDPLC
jgi:hypothetical protein